jgi:hypothetical protein
VEDNDCTGGILQVVHRDPETVSPWSSNRNNTPVRGTPRQER